MPIPTVTVDEIQIDLAPAQRTSLRNRIRMSNPVMQASVSNPAACGMENWPFTAMYPHRIAEAK